MPVPSSAPSTKPPDGPPNVGTAPGDDGRWSVELHRAVAKTIARNGEDLVIRPTVGELIDALETNPKQFPKKAGGLRGVRAVPVVFAEGVAWRAVFTIDERTRTVRVIALGPHDDAYTDAERRL